MDRRWCHFVKRTVHSVADLEVLFKRLEVNVGRFFFNRLIQNKIDVADDRCGVRLCLEIRCIHAVAGQFELAEKVFHRLPLAAVAFVDFRLDEVIGSDDHVDFPA